MESSLDKTPETTAAMQEQITKLQLQVEQLAAKVKWYEEQFRLSQQKKFGASSERTHPDQLLLFNEPEAEADPAQAEPTMETITYRRKKERGQREAMLEDLRVETIEYQLPEAERACPCCNGPLHPMSTEVRQELKIIPAEVKVLRHVRHVYSCRQCERESTQTPVITAAMPNPAAPGSLASPSLLAYIMTQKCRRHVAVPAGAAIRPPRCTAVPADAGQLDDPGVQPLARAPV